MKYSYALACYQYISPAINPSFVELSFCCHCANKSEMKHGVSINLSNMFDFVSLLRDLTHFGQRREPGSLVFIYRNLIFITWSNTFTVITKAQLCIVNFHIWRRLYCLHVRLPHLSHAVSTKPNIRIFTKFGLQGCHEGLWEIVHVYLIN